jgi:hypothetical protein
MNTEDINTHAETITSPSTRILSLFEQRFLKMAGVAVDSEATYRYAMNWLLAKDLRVLDISNTNRGNNCFFVAVQMATEGQYVDTVTNTRVVLRNIPVEELRTKVCEYADSVWNAKTDPYHEGMWLHLQHEIGDGRPDTGLNDVYQQWRRGAISDAMADNLVMELFTGRHRMKMQVFFPPRQEVLRRAVSGK